MATATALKLLSRNSRVFFNFLCPRNLEKERWDSFNNFLSSFDNLDFLKNKTHSRIASISESVQLFKSFCLSFGSVAAIIESRKCLFSKTADSILTLWLVKREAFIFEVFFVKAIFSSFQGHYWTRVMSGIFPRPIYFYSFQGYDWTRELSKTSIKGSFFSTFSSLVFNSASSSH